MPGFDKLNFFRLSTVNREIAQEIYNQVLHVFVNRKLFDQIDDLTLLDMITFEILRSAKSSELQIGIGQPQFTQGFVEEFKKFTNRETLMSLAGSIEDDQNNDIENYIKHFITWVAVFVEDRPIVRREVYGEYINDILSLFTTVPFWVKPRDSFARALFFFRLCLILSQSNLRLPRAKSIELYSEIRPLIINAFPQSTPLYHQVLYKKHDLTEEINKQISSDLSKGWALMFTHLDYSRIILWRNLKKHSPDCFMKRFVVNSLGPLAAKGYIDLDQMGDIKKIARSTFPSQEKLEALQNCLQRIQKKGKLFRLEEFDDHRMLSFIKKNGGFNYWRVFYNNKHFKCFRHETPEVKHNDESFFF